MTTVSRRTFVVSAAAAGVAPLVTLRDVTGQDATVAAPALPAAFPSHPQPLAQEIVGASHGNVARVKELLAERPALARASYDWGYGDWETALGAASHVGNREIAELLIANGAHPTIFSAAMLGQLETVKAFVAAAPGVQRIRGPHGITLLSHARAGGERAAPVAAYLQTLGDADTGHPNQPLDAAAAAELTGTYIFGTTSLDRFTVSVSAAGAIMIKRDGGSDRRLSHHGGRVFNPAGAEAVRIRFTPETGRATALTVNDGPLAVTARRA